MEQRMSSRDISLDQPLDADSGTTLGDLESGHEESIEDTLEHQESLKILRQNLDRIKEDLNDRELYILVERLLSDEPKKLQEIGEEWGVTREAVRQMEARVMKKIKQAFEESVRHGRN
jgi:RNA polymerase sigma-32 factor